MSQIKVGDKGWTSDMEPTTVTKVVGNQIWYKNAEGKAAWCCANRWLNRLRSKPLKDTTNKAVDVVKLPSHYQFFPGVEAIEIIAASLSEEGFHGYCMGNRLKYRLRAGNKDKLEQDISKSDFYVELFNKHKHLCKAAK